MKKPTPKSQLLEDLIGRAVSLGADSLNIEYCDGYEEICAVKDSVGVGIAKIDSSSDEALALRDRLHSIGKMGKGIETTEGSFRLIVTTYDHFMETAYNVEINKK